MSQLEVALTQIAEGEGQRVIDMIDNAPPGQIETRWGFGFRDYDGCMAYIRANGIKAPKGGLALPLPYTVCERPTYSVVPSNAVWRDPARADIRLRLALVFPYCLYRPDRARRRPMPQKRRGPVLCLLLGR